MENPLPFSFETLALNSLNYLENLVDADGQPYFNVFWTEPTQAAHDWPDFGDVMSRQLQGAIMARRMTGREAVTERIWLRKSLALIDPLDGLLHRPMTTYSQAVADWGDAALTLYALATAALDYDNENLRRVTLRMAEGMLQMLRQNTYPENWLGCFAVKSLMIVARLLDSEPALEAARILVKKYIIHSPTFTPDNTFGAWGHMHGNLRSLVGAADYALTINDPILYSRVDALYRYVKTTGTRFGFLPEVVGRQSPIISCETCALMDYAGLGVTLANHGHPEYWGDMERLARNQLAESQVIDVAWLTSDDPLPDTDQFTWRAIGARILGAWAGWSSPNHLLAACESLNTHWGGPELHDKTRLLQNCCGGSGIHALFILWKNAARFEDGVLSVNMHLDKSLPEAEIRCLQPYEGRLSITLAQECNVRVRIPEFTRPSQMQVNINGIQLHDVPPIPGLPAPPYQPDRIPSPIPSFGNYLELGHHQSGDIIEVFYPLPINTEEVAIGNPGYRAWHYQVTWKGDTVIRMEPLANEVTTAFSDFDKREVPVFYGRSGPSPLYQREHLLNQQSPSVSPLRMDDGALDFWKIAEV